MSTQAALPEVEVSPLTALALKKRVQDLDSAIKAFSKLATADEYQQVTQIGLAAAKVAKEATAFYADEVGKLHQLWQEKCQERSSIVTPAENVKNLAGRLCGEWQREAERQRQEAERKLQEEQRRLAEDEAVAIAAALEKDGRHEEAEAIVSTPVEVAPVSVPTAVPRVNGVSKPRDNWVGTVTSMSLLVKAVAEGKVPIGVLEVNQSVLNTFARTLLKNIVQWPGVKVTNNPKSAFRG
jgi:hypothetical protein